MKPTKPPPRFALVLLLLVAISAVLWISHWFERGKTSDGSQSEQPDNSNAGDLGAKTDPPTAARTNPNGHTTENVAGSAEDPAARLEGAGSSKELAEFIRQFAATGASTSDLLRKLAALGLKDQPWWRNSDEVSALLDLASDPSIAEQYRVVAMSIYLAAAPQNQVSQNSTAIQQLASGGSDEMASVVLQGMADRTVAPSALTRETLASDARGTGAKCYAWNAARLTEKNDPELAAIALVAPESRMTEATKVGFDYLAAGSFSEVYAADPSFRRKTDALLETVHSLPTNTDTMGLANGDAFIRALPSMLPTDPAIDSLFSLLHEAQNPEMRLSAIEQLVSLHLSGSCDLTQKLHEVRNQIATLLPDPVKQDRAKIRLNRIQNQRLPK